MRYVLPALLFALLSTPATAQPSPSADTPTLSDEQVQAALARASDKREIKPARVGRRATLVRSALQYELGKVYTASALIAVQAKAAAAGYKTFTAADVDADMRADVLTFVVPPLVERAMDDRPAETVLILPKGSKDPAAAVRPLWRKTDVATYQNAFGATWQQSTVIVGFPKTVATAGMEFVVVYRGGQERRGELVDPLP